MADIIVISFLILMVVAFIWVLGFLLCLMGAESVGKVNDETARVFAIWPIWLLFILPIKLVRNTWKILKHEFKKAIN
jgi:hypothetical protein